LNLIAFKRRVKCNALKCFFLLIEFAFFLTSHRCLDIWTELPVNVVKDLLKNKVHGNISEVDQYHACQRCNFQLHFDICLRCETCSLRMFPEMKKTAHCYTTCFVPGLPTLRLFSINVGGKLWLPFHALFQAQKGTWVESPKFCKKKLDSYVTKDTKSFVWFEP
jgi:hypothetical protein